MKAEDILSGEAALKNLPAFILLSGLTVLIAVRCAVGLLFSVYRRQHRHFLTSLLVGGADAAFVDRFVRTESLFIWICAFPAAALFGTAQLTVLRRIAADWFSRNLGAQTPVDIRGSLLCCAAAGLIVLWMTLSGFRKSSTGLSVKNPPRDSAAGLFVMGHQLSFDKL